MVVALVAAILAWPLAGVVIGLANIEGGPDLLAMALGAFAISAALSILYVVRRMFQDDRRTRDLLAERLLAESPSVTQEPTV